MKILLAACNAKYIHSNLAVYDLQAYASDYADHIVLKEYTINQQKDDIMRDIYLEHPDVVCVSCYIWNLSFVKELMADLIKILPGADFWAGGPEVSYDAEKFLIENSEFKGVMVGEGEETFKELAGYYVEKNPQDLKNMTGICYRDGDQIIHNGWRQIMDLSSIPFIYKDLSEFKNRIIYYESSRGCPFSCSYCLSSIDKKLRFRDTETVKKELQFFIDNKVPQVKFVDRTFNCKHDHAMAIWKYINEHDNGVTNFHFEISADLLREEELQEMSTMRPGLIQLEIGVQSTNPDTIKAIHRTMDFEKLKGIVDRIHSFGNIHQHLDLIAGLPYEDYDSFRHSFNDVYALKPQQLQLGFLKVLKGSHMMEMCREYGIVYKTQEPYEVLSTKWLDYDHVLKLKTVENMVEVYYNSGQFQNTLEYLENFFQDAFSIYERLGSFYMEKGYGDVSHTRMRRYEILLEFLEDVPEISMDQVKDQMVYDLYLRENLKSRPGFARDQKPFERQVWDFRKREKVAKNAHVEVFADGTVLLFNYADRDPLTNNAHVTDVTKDVFENLNRD
ncbi:B12-binding domain-containing radical SAM protein [Blautia wexlerae]|mgnify:FL=1|uniref:B12-binding domain-containing radical SAM protein n=1 Tax=Blautia wexlerae TaxID=418240 RepID=UPI001570FBE2|nr:B12-binding domain-containing radical SAM protein [Blautia wexlerae]MCB5710441.1 B12-binding domain-containing radical SAM protein [Blautia wexlerae]NSF96048.1 B12-binding domain-containing radical SAM protein [Blautia wexlerae]NSF99553.1 B12-binding domain-containing radical SAM protein [Blautia wexlerae]NSG10142.1 B12-binding domain-containing radical SAM protein [Blautia wexlerae]NSG37596.1 B12-binding domain-containing radical SAM protein [Blautia wexlerae]